MRNKARALALVLSFYGGFGQAAEFKPGSLAPPAQPTSLALPAFPIQSAAASSPASFSFPDFSGGFFGAGLSPRLPPESPAKPGRSTRDILGGLSGPSGDVSDEELYQFGSAFDSSGKNGSVPPVPGAAAAPRLPPGAREVSVHAVRSAEDIDRYIPQGGNSKRLIQALKDDVEKMAPYNIYVYTDAFGGHFSAIDIGGNRSLVSMIPELLDHEKRLIKKIRHRNPDIQVLVREKNRTPDLIVGGVVMELKSSFEYLGSANAQVLEHGRRHGLGHGTAAIGLPYESRNMDVERMAAKIDQWRRGVEASVLDRIYVFAGKRMVVFVRQTDGSYRVDDSDTPFGPGGESRPIDPKDVHRLQLLAKKGHLKQATAALHFLESSAGYRIEKNSSLDQTRELLEAQGAYRRILKLIKNGDRIAAGRTWENFSRTHSAEAVKKIEPAIVRMLSPFNLPDTLRFTRDGDRAALVLRENGIVATVAVFGSARIRSREDARRIYDKTFERVGRSPVSSLDRRALEEARLGLENSEHYEQARRFGALAVRRGAGKLAVATTGAPGIMEAANRGAFEAGGPSVSYVVRVAREPRANVYVTEGLSLEFDNSVNRKKSLRQGAMALVFFPGGYGTMDEMFEALGQMRGGGMPRAPIILVGKRQDWEKAVNFKEWSRAGLINDEEMSLLRFAATPEKAWAAIEYGMRAEE